MNVLNRSAGRRYTINDAWLARFTKDATEQDKGRYVDFNEIRKGTSQYVADIIAMGVNTSIDQERQRADFRLNGIRVGDTDDGHYIDSILEGEGPPQRDQQKYTEGINHPERHVRVWAWETTARHISFVGL